MPKGKKRKRGLNASASISKHGLQMTPERALEVRLGLARKKSVAPLKPNKNSLPTPDIKKKILAFQSDEFQYIVHVAYPFRLPNGEIGVLYRKAVHPLRNSGEYLFIDISTTRTPKKACNVALSSDIFSTQIPFSSSISLKLLAKKFSEHPDARTLRKLADQPVKNPVKVARAPRAVTPAKTFADRWLRQLNLSQNRTASDEVRKRALISLEEIEKEMAALDDNFKWPSTEAATGSGNLKSFDAPPEGVLSFFGYQVGKSSELKPLSRFHILDRVFRITLPPILPRSHMALWGPPNSGARLKKIAETIAALVRNAKRRRNDSYNQAISEWEFDLRCLHDTLYVGRFSFGWPEHD